MINLFLIVLATSEINKHRIEDVIKRASGWWHYFDSVWIISTERTLVQWQAVIREQIADEDRFLIVDITRQERNGWLPSKAWSWLSDQEHRTIAQDQQ